MKVLIVEDEKLNYDWLQNLLANNYPDIKVFDQAEDLKTAVKLFNQVQPDIIFLDIKLGKDNGFELFELIPKPYPIIIFTTAHDQFVIDAIRKGAHDYLLKPVRLKELKNAFGRIKFTKPINELSTPDKETIVFKTQGESHFLKVEDIVYVKAERAYATVFTRTDELLLSQPLKEISAKLPNFFKSHRSFIINPLHIKRFISGNGLNHIEMASGVEIPLSDTNLKEFKLRFGV